MQSLESAVQASERDSAVKVMTDELEAIGKGFFMNSVPEGTAAMSGRSPLLARAKSSVVELATWRLGRYWFPVPEAADILVQGPGLKLHKAIVQRSC